LFFLEIHRKHLPILIKGVGRIDFPVRRQPALGDIVRIFKVANIGNFLKPVAIVPVVYSRVKIQPKKGWADKILESAQVKRNDAKSAVSA
jgi:hypothetical protein